MTQTDAIRKRCVDAEDLLREDVPALLDEVDRLTKLVAAQKEIIAEFVHHDDDCLPGRACRCGLCGAREKAAALDGNR